MDGFLFDGLKAVIGTILTGLVAYLVDLARRRVRRMREYKNMLELLNLHWAVKEKSVQSDEVRAQYDLLSGRYTDIVKIIEGIDTSDSKRDFFDIAIIILPSLIFSAILFKQTDSNFDTTVAVFISIFLFTLSLSAAVVIENYIVRRITSNVLGYFTSFIIGVFLLVIFMSIISYF